MTITELYDGQGLGNQLWCYIVTRVIAKDHGYDFGIQSPEKFKGKDFMAVDFGRPVTGGSGPEGGPPTFLPNGIHHYYKERRIIHPANNADISIHDYRLVRVPDDTKIDGTMQDEQYILHRRNEIRHWLKVKPEFECFDYADDNTCIINFRGGEYMKIPAVLLKPSYYRNAVANMLKVNPKLRFVVITDDVASAKKYFPQYDVFHFNIAKDYIVIKNAKYLILSNSSFAWFPAWLNENLRYCISPKYWWGHNNSDGYWACGYNLTSGWMHQDRDGKLQTYEECQSEWKDYIQTHQDYFVPKKIERNFLVVSSYNNDVSWIPERTSDFIMYDRSEHPIYPYTFDQTKVMRSPNIGYNLYDYFTYIIDHYEALPECMIFAKANTFPRHVTEYYFDQVSNSRVLTPMIDVSQHTPKRPTAYFSAEGLYNEQNKPNMMPRLTKKYFTTYNDFLRLCYLHPFFPKYIAFAPGANYIVPRGNVLRLPKVFYENLRMFISHTPLAGEAHLIERGLYTLWSSGGELNPIMTKPITESEITLALHSQPVKYRVIKKLLPGPIQRTLWKIMKSVHDASKRISQQQAAHHRTSSVTISHDNQLTTSTPRQTRYPSIERVIIWGHKNDGHTHSYIHTGYFKAFQALGFETYYFDDREAKKLKNFNFENSLFFTEGQVEKEIPLIASAKYVLHHADLAKYDEHQLKYINLGNYLKYCDEGVSPYHKENRVTQVNDCAFWDDTSKTLYQPWATFLLPREIDSDNFVLFDEHRNNINYIGAAYDYNRENMEKFGAAAEAHGKNFITGKDIPEDRSYELVRDSYITVDIRGPWHIECGYLPCRVFKNLSYGKYIGVNSEHVGKIFGEYVTYEPDAGKLFEATVNGYKNMDPKKMSEAMEFIKAKHTYINRIQNLLRYI